MRGGCEAASANDLGARAVLGIEADAHRDHAVAGERLWNGEEPLHGFAGIDHIVAVMGARGKRAEDLAFRAVGRQRVLAVHLRVDQTRLLVERRQGGVHNVAANELDLFLPGGLAHVQRDLRIDERIDSGEKRDREHHEREPFTEPELERRERLDHGEVDARAVDLRGKESAGCNQRDEAEHAEGKAQGIGQQNGEGACGCAIACNEAGQEDDAEQKQQGQGRYGLGAHQRAECDERHAEDLTEGPHGRGDFSFRKGAMVKGFAFVSACTVLRKKASRLMAG